MRKNEGDSVGALLRSLVFLGAFLLMGTLAFAQIGGTGGVSGTVTDSSGAAVAGTNILVTNTATGVSNKVGTDSAGRYAMPNLPVGSYSVTAEKTGFQQSITTGIELSVGSTSVVNLVLRVGAVSQSVEVAAAAQTVQTESPTLGLVVATQEVEDLPLNGRSYIQLASFQPGVTTVPANTVNGFGEGTPARLSVNGARQEGQLLLVDGVNTVGLWGNSTGAQLAGTALGVQAISQFQVLTGIYGAQYPGFGIVVDGAIRTGTNQFHGDVYLYDRNDALDALNYFEPTAGPAPLTREQYGADLGGPIKRNKLFFFANWEGVHQNLGETLSPDMVPDANAHLGLIPCYRAPDEPCGANGLVNMAALFPSQFALIQPVLNTYPNPNGAEILSPTGGPSGAGFYNTFLVSPTTENYGVGKLEYNLSSTNSLGLTYIIDKANLVQPVLVPTNGGQNLVSTQKSNQAVLTDRAILSSSMVNTARLQFFRPEVTSTTPLTPALVIVPGRLGGSWGVTGSNWTGIGGGGLISSAMTMWGGGDQVSWVRGKHTLVMGADVIRNEWNINWPSGSQGAWTFPTMEAFYKATPSLFAGAPPFETTAMHGFRFSSMQPYIEDTFQATKKLTITMGVRYDYNTNISEAHGILYNITNITTSTTFTNVPYFSWNNPSVKDVAPRVGFAWDPFGNGKTSIRGGFGIYYDAPIAFELTAAYDTTRPFYSASISNPQFPNPFANNPGAPPQTPARSQGYSYGAPGQYPNSTMPYMETYTLNIQRQIAPGTVFSIGYTGTHGVHLNIASNWNACTPTGTDANGYYLRNYGATPALSYSIAQAGCPRPNTNFTTITTTFPQGFSKYDGLQVSVARTLSKGLTFQAAYTWSRCTSIGDEYTGGDSVNVGSKGGSSGGQLPGIDANIRGNLYDYAPCAFNLTHQLNSNILYQLPFTGSRLKEGWQIALIETGHTGFLTTPLVGVDAANCGFNSCAGVDRPDVVPGCNLYANQSIKNWYNVNCFTEPLGRFGNEGLSIIKGPLFSQFDLSLQKTTKLTESKSVNLRADVFNFVNHPNMDFPTFTLFTDINGTRNPLGSQITTTGSYAQRQIQLSATFKF